MMNWLTSAAGSRKSQRSSEGGSDSGSGSTSPSTSDQSLGSQELLTNIKVVGSSGRQVVGSALHETFLVQVEDCNKSLTRAPVHICCVIDISGSMGIDAEIQNEKGDVERTGLSVLDVTKHAVRTILATLQEQDMISIVTFSCRANKALKPTKCSIGGVAKATSVLENLSPDLSTNLWDGIKTGLEVMTQERDETRANLKLANAGEDCTMRHMFVLTDGVPNSNPPRGIVPSLTQLIDSYPDGCPCEINTFGFGYSLQTQVLCEIASVGGGTFSFSPDAGMVGTVFIHALARCCSASVQSAVFSKEAGALVKHFNDWELAGEKPSLCSSVGALLAGESRWFVVDVDVTHLPEGETALEVGLAVNDFAGHKHTCMAQGKSRSGKDPTSQAIADRIRVVQGRNAVAGFLSKATSKEFRETNTVRRQWQAVRSKLEALQTKLKTPTELAVFLALVEDFDGQVKEAVSSPEYWKKWGIHYCAALHFAHARECCTNFKDPGVQVYATGALFNSLRTHAEKSFETLPPPKASNRRTGQAAMTSLGMVTSYYNRNNGCFAGTCIVTMGDGSVKQVQDVRKGDKVSVGGMGDSESGTIVCVLKTKIKQDGIEMVELPGGLIVTPYHPIQVRGTDGDHGDIEWAFPISLTAGTTRVHRIDAIYTFITDKGCSIGINGWQCVVLGHNLTGKVVGHPYFGTRAVVDDLSTTFPHQFQQGLVEVGEDAFHRDPATNLITGLEQA